jgi:2-methylisocitrate lyase-like PEP mutase family enzyme
MDLTTKVAQFQALHRRPGAFVVPNPWDTGSARLLTMMGFEALATTSSGRAWSLGRRDGEGLVSREETLAGARAILAGTHLPVSADLENGFGDSPETCAETIRQAAANGLAGGSIEDSTGKQGSAVYDFTLAVERVRAAAEAARPSGFVLTARTENFLKGRNDLDDTIKRLQAFAQAGANVLFAPGLPDLDSVRLVCSSVDRPVNLLIGPGLQSLTLAEIAAAGVKRVSVGGALARAAFSAFLAAARETKDLGTFGWTTTILPFADLNQRMKGSATDA